MIEKNSKEKSKKSANEQLHEKIALKNESMWSKWSSAEQKKVFSFAKGYMDFMKSNKTERMCVSTIVDTLKKKGFKDLEKVTMLKTGDKVYRVFKEKTVFAFIVGKNKESFQLVGSHCDSPRLDLKPHPLYEDSGFALLQSHYYGGIKKYQWVNTPLAVHGVAYTKKGKRVDIHLGDNPGDPAFIIPDLLPHLSQHQMERKASKIIEGEELNIIVGHLPVQDKKISEKVKHTVLAHLYETYGLIEEDFSIAELEFVPAANPVEIGFDRALIAAYGQDDKVCVYTSLQAFLDVSSPKHTALAMFVDKEEIGSMGNTGAASLILETIATEYVQKAKLNISVSKLLVDSKAISADVTAGQDPTFKDVNDPHNVSYLGHGISVEKYGGGGGKYSTNDANAEYMQEVREILDTHNIGWQTGENGRIDVGGGGTIAMFISRYGMDCVDAGPCVLAMHAPMEVTSKADIYSSYLFYKAFFQN